MSVNTPPEGGVESTATAAEEDILIGRLTANFSGAKRVDLYICERGVEQLRFPDIPVHSGARLYIR